MEAPKIFKKDNKEYGLVKDYPEKRNALYEYNTPLGTIMECFTYHELGLIEERSVDNRVSTETKYWKMR